MSTRGERIRLALAARGVRKQQALAAELDVHESAITRWKENAALSLDNAVKLGAVLDISLDWLLLGHNPHAIESCKVTKNNQKKSRHPTSVRSVRCSINSTFRSTTSALPTSTPPVRPSRL
jgi:plasmid maintenance system antidote protein VapI